MHISRVASTVKGLRTDNEYALNKEVCFNNISSYETVVVSCCCDLYSWPLSIKLSVVK